MPSDAPRSPVPSPAPPPVAGAVPTSLTASAEAVRKAAAATVAPPPSESWPLWPNFGCAGQGSEPRDPAGTEDERASERPRLDLHLVDLPVGAPPRGLVIICPGGGYHRRSAHEGAPVAAWLNSLGLHAAVLHYRLWPWRFPAALRDARRAIRLVRTAATRLRIDPTRIGILGFSAGGHLAASAATAHATPTLDAGDDLAGTEHSAGVSARPDALISCYAVLSAYEHRHHGSIEALLGPEPWDPAAQRSVSLEYAVSPATPPTFLWHTSEDRPVPADNSLLFAAACRRHVVPFALHIYPRGWHGLGLAEGAPAGAWREACATWLTELGWRG